MLENTAVLATAAAEAAIASKEESRDAQNFAVSKIRSLEAFLEGDRRSRHHLLI